MKIFSFKGFFLLQDDFKGGLSDALRAMADYHDQSKNTPKQKLGEVYKNSSDLSDDILWDRFLEGIAKDARLTAGASLSTYDDNLNISHVEHGDNFLKK